MKILQHMLRIFRFFAIFASFNVYYDASSQHMTHNIQLFLAGNSWLVFFSSNKFAKDLQPQEMCISTVC